MADDGALLLETSCQAGPEGDADLLPHSVQGWPRRSWKPSTPSSSGCPTGA